MGAKDQNHHQEQGSEAAIQNPPPNPNPNCISPAQFLSWKRQKDVDASARKAEVQRKRAEDVAAGLVQMNGRELFHSEPWVFDNSRY